MMNKLSYWYLVEEVLHCIIVRVLYQHIYTSMLSCVIV